MTEPDFERRLRDSMDAHAGRAPSGDGLAELIIAEAVYGATPIRSHRSTRTWLLPLLAAAAVAVVVLSVVGITAWRPDSQPAPPALSQSAATLSPTPTVSSPTPTKPSPSVSKPAPSVSPTTGAAGQPLPNGETVHGFNATDLTFYGADDGWALGSADCTKSGRCTAMYRTTDGATWHSIGGEQFNVPGVLHCAAPCVSNIRFANPSVGYAYGPSALFMTTDGGVTWVEQKGAGGAVALETLDHNVIRVVSDNGTPCDAGCSVHVEIAGIGSPTWTTVDLPGGASTRVGLQLTRTGSQAFLLMLGDPVGGGTTAFSTLFRSSDDGTTWTRNAGDPCPQSGSHEVDARAVTAGTSGVSVLCQPRQDTGSTFVAISTDGGASFAASGGTLPSGVLLTGDPTTVLIAAGADAYRSTDGGASWHAVAALSGRPGGVSFIGFESQTVGRAITDNGREIWTTSNAGQTWTPVHFPT